MLTLIDFVVFVVGAFLGLPLAWKIGSLCFSLLPHHVQNDFSWCTGPEILQQSLPGSLIALTGLIVAVIAIFLVNRLLPSHGMLRRLCEGVEEVLWEFKLAYVMGSLGMGLLAAFLIFILFLLAVVPEYLERIPLVGTAIKWIYIVFVVLQIIDPARGSSLREQY